jgi:hypothetical protein
MMARQAQVRLGENGGYAQEKAAGQPLLCSAATK